MRGDINGDHFVDLSDAILGLELISRMDVSDTDIFLNADVDGDEKIGMADVIYILQLISQEDE